MTTAVLDASALLAWVRDEPGAEVVEPLIPGGTVCAVNWSEIWQKLAQRSVNAELVTNRLLALGVRVEPLTELDAVHAARLWPRTRQAGLPLGDRCCLALAARLDASAVTADSSWDELDIDVTIVVIRERAPGV